ncbi:MAG: sodium:alanine symporter family protein [Deltaproteobacteria bacterium]|nr:sodium:alanine symporter family protein [Deltaproteobacteria bacterium]
MEEFNAVLGSLAGYVWGLPLIVLLVGTGVVLSFLLKFVQVSRFGHAIKAIAGKFDNPADKGEVSHFRALTSALSGTIGLGNIAGVAVAISLGGPGALFWMWLSALFGMATKFATCTLSTKYRSIDENGVVAGGPMFTIENGLGKKWRPLGMTFALFTMGASFGMANLFQANQVASSLYSQLSVPTWISGILMVVFVSLVIIGGIKRIGSVTGKLVPFMCGIYLLMAVIVLALAGWSNIVQGLSLIVSSAFNGIEPAAGGFAGIAVWTVIQQGVRRGTFSHEAGLGSAPIAHAAVKTGEPVREGLVAMLGPFLDTIIVCTMTALVIITTGAWKVGAAPAIIVDRIEKTDAGSRGVVMGPDVREGYEHPARTRGRKVTWRGKIFSIQQQAFQERFGVHVGHGIRQSCFALVDESISKGLALHQGDMVQIDGILDGTVGGAVLTTYAFTSVFGKYGSYVILLAVVLFALSTMITWSYYGDRAALYLFGQKGVLPYRILFIVIVFIGAVYSLDPVVNISDILNGLMAVPNLIATIMLLPVVLKLTKKYFAKYG